MSSDLNDPVATPARVKVLEQALRNIQFLAARDTECPEPGASMIFVKNADEIRKVASDALPE